jgi:transcriptional regulator of acetoin/glycerol metabolism
VLDEIGARSGRARPELSEDAREALVRYTWPGNIRELRNVLERALLFCRDDLIDRATLQFDRSFDAAEEPEGQSQTLDDAERSHILRILRRTGGRVDQAAKILALSRSSLYAKLKRYGIRAAEG